MVVQPSFVSEPYKALYDDWSEDVVVLCGINRKQTLNITVLVQLFARDTML